MDGERSLGTHFRGLVVEFLRGGVKVSWLNWTNRVARIETCSSRAISSVGTLVDESP